MKSNFIRSIAILSGGNLAAQAVNFLTYLILPKYFYTPEAFGVFGLFLAIYFTLFEIVNLKMDQSVMLPKDDGEAAGLLGVSWAIAVFVSLGALVVLLTLNVRFHWLPPFFPWVITAGLFLGGFIQPAMVFLNRQRAYSRMGRVRILQALVTLGASVAGYYWIHRSLNGLVAGFLAGQAAAFILIIPMMPRNRIRIAGSHVVDRYNQFIRYGSLSAMISTLSRNMPVFFLKPFFGDTVLGWYTLATKFLNAPAGIFSASVGQVYYREASTAEPAALKALTRSVVLNILGLAIIPSLILLFFGAVIFDAVFGESWKPAGMVLQVLMLWYFVAYASGPVSMLLDIKLKLDWELGYNIFLLIGRTAALLSALWWNNVFLVLGIYTAIGVVFNCLLLAYVLKLSGEPGKTRGDDAH